jgi:hypothetical protein
MSLIVTQAGQLSIVITVAAVFYGKWNIQAESSKIMFYTDMAFNTIHTKNTGPHICVYFPYDVVIIITEI